MRMTADIQRAFTLIELLMSLAIAALLLTAMTGVVSNVANIRDDTRARNDAIGSARFAMQRMVAAVTGTRRLLLPLADNPKTNWRENLREQTVPPSSPEGSSTSATAVLAVTLDPRLDIDRDGFADADNDKDGRVDEDLSDDNNNDAAPGILGIDDDGDGEVDEGPKLSPETDNDEDGVVADDWIDGIDNDADGSIDEDIKKDMNRDSKSGIAGVDDDGDGSVDEGNFHDDDEDGTTNEDNYDAVVFFLSGTTLIERRPELDAIDGTDFIESPIADNVSRFRIERIPDAGRRAVLVDITLELTYSGIDPISLNTRVRVSGGQ